MADNDESDWLEETVEWFMGPLKKVETPAAPKPPEPKPPEVKEETKTVKAKRKLTFLWDDDEVEPKEKKKKKDDDE